jgi:amino acid adenylation domain-containing protein
LVSAVLLSVPARQVTTAQRKLITYQQLYPKDASYNLAFAYRIDGAVDIARLRRALGRIVSEIRAFTTTFSTAEAVPTAVLHGPHGSAPGEHVIRVVPVPAGGEDELIRRFSEIADQPIAPDRWPLVEVTIHAGDGVAYLTILLSHLAGDAYTFYNITRLISQLYENPTAEIPSADLDPSAFLPEPPPRPDAVEFFRRELDGVSSLLPEQLADCRDADGVTRGRRLRVRVDDARARRVSRWMDEHNIGRFPFFLAVHLLLLSAVTGRDDLVVGVPLANRRGQRQRAGFGYFVNTLPLAVDLADFLGFPTLCRALATRTTALVRHQSFDLTAHAGLVFDTAPPRLMLGSTFTYYKEALGIQLAGGRVTALDLRRTQVMFPLTLNVEDDGNGFWLHIEHAEHLAPARPLALLDEILDAVTAAPAVPLAAVSAVGTDERQRIDRMVSARVDYPTAGSAATAFEISAACHAGRVAVEDAAGTWTYAELDRYANQIARRLLHEVPGQYVAVSMTPSRELIATLLGVLKAGKCYVPLDPQAPQGRIRHIVEQFEALPVVAAAHAFNLPGYPHRIDLTTLLTDAAMESPYRPDRVDDPERTAYVIFTSGSTGQPKGVQVNHRNLLRLFTSADEHFDFGSADTWCLFHSYAFDFSVWEMYGALLYGGRLVVVPDRIRRSPAEFLEFVCDTGVTVLNQTPSAFRQLLGSLTPAHADRLAVRYVVFGGEALRFDSVRPWYAVMGERARLVNMYGITETTVHVTYYALTPDQVVGETRSIIGRPLGDLSVYVVDRYLRPCPMGVTGELLIGGSGVALGYLNQPELTRTRFRDDIRPGEVLYRSGDLGYVLPDGRLVYIGRSDRQVQLRGYRIELGEVEAALHTVDAVQECVIRLDERPGIQPRLVAYLVIREGFSPPSDRELRAALKGLLPPYMIPACFLRLPSLPLTTNGKLDEAGLPVPPDDPADPASGGPGPTSEQGGVRGAIADIWRRLLRTNQFEDDDNFFDIGGTSMHVTEVHRQLIERFGVANLQMVDLFEYPTINALSRYIVELTEER